MNCPGESWMSQPESMSFGYFSGNLGEVITPLGSVSISPVNTEKTRIKLEKRSRQNGVTYEQNSTNFCVD